MRSIGSREHDAMPQVPYIVGQWVRAERFYGRTALLNFTAREN